MRKSSHETLQERFLEWAIIRIEPSTAAVAMFVARMHRDGDCTHSGSLNSEYTSPFRSRVLKYRGQPCRGNQVFAVLHFSQPKIQQGNMLVMGYSACINYGVNSGRRVGLKEVQGILAGWKARRRAHDLCHRVRMHKWHSHQPWPCCSSARSRPTSPLPASARALAGWSILSRLRPHWAK